MPDKLTKEQRHKCMKSIRSTDTGIEVSLRKALWAKGYRYRKNVRDLPGKPDIVMSKYKLVIFCDSEFFHGKDWENGLKAQLLRGNNSEFWINKISRNIERDARNNALLVSTGWTVLRLWGKEIEKDMDSCVKRIEDVIKSKH